MGNINIRTVGAECASGNEKKFKEHFDAEITLRHRKNIISRRCEHNDTQNRINYHCVFGHIINKNNLNGNKKPNSRTRIL